MAAPPPDRCPNMQTIRQTFEHAPAVIPVPETARGRRVEIILLVQDDDAACDLKSVLSSMPDVGEDSDFSRQADRGRGELTWDS